MGVDLTDARLLPAPATRVRIPDETSTRQTALFPMSVSSSTSGSTTHIEVGMT